MPTIPPLLHIENLTTSFQSNDTVVQAVRGINLRVNHAEILAIVGESGCGKSVTALSILRLISMPPGRFDSGKIKFNNHDLLSLSEADMQKVRGNDISMIFQEPMTSLNPIFTIGDQIGEAIIQHQSTTGAEARKQTLELLYKVSIPSPEIRIDQYPHELSGGMKQRVMIAIAIACRPTLLIADEPTTALDVTIQDQILNLLSSLKEDSEMSILLITHNLGIVAQFADRVTVMYSGKIVEEATVDSLFENPMHPYTRGLLNSLPKDDNESKLEPISGAVPHPAFLPKGCAFHPRCKDAMPRCQQQPPLTSATKENTHKVACWLYEEWVEDPQ
ncbi:ABC transporter ATP-binding protein [Nitrospinaceae bacterium]|nr:ABC transporter ATP-binding protein [Nitrospinaceae bacterium]